MSGEIIAIGVAFSWTICSLFFENAARRIGSINVNIIRLIFGFLFIGLTMVCINGHFLPQHTSQATYLWMLASGLVGFVFGDTFLFASYTLMPARFSQLMMTLAPAFSALAGFLMLGERISLLGFVGMAVTLFGIGLSVLTKETGGEHKMHLSLPLKGLLFGLLGAVGQGLGIVLSKEGMMAYEDVYTPQNALYIPLAATQIRAMAGIVGFFIMIVCKGGLGDLWRACTNRKGVGATFVGSIFGPFLGVTLSLLAVQHTNTAIASTIMATVPVVILLPEYFILKRTVTRYQVLGAIISVIGVSLFFL